MHNTQTANPAVQDASLSDNPLISMGLKRWMPPGECLDSM